jgi:branched-chain amino acid transport system permease protein
MAFGAGPVAAAVTGFVVGAICVRLNKLYYGMLQISLGSLIWIVVLRWYSLTNGDDGIHGIPMPEFLSSATGIYYFVLGVVVVCLALMYLILKSPFGATLRAIRDNPQRCEAVGINVRRHQLLGVVVATFFAGVAGVPYSRLAARVSSDMSSSLLQIDVGVIGVPGDHVTTFRNRSAMSLTQSSAVSVLLPCVL